jgi:hypothetical protein
MGRGCVDLLILNLGTSWRVVSSFTSRSLLTKEKALRSHLIGGWVGPRTSLDDLEKRRILTLLRLELRPLPLPSSP